VASAGNALWQSVAVVGDAGVNHLGYYTCVWSPDGRSIATHGHSGALHVWDAVRDAVRDEEDAGVRYEPRVPACCCGHMGAVVDSSWSPDGDILCTVSVDQTCRFWGRVDDCWREVGRPQVHGHDFSCVAFVSNDVYVSGSEEKVLRVFARPDGATRVKLPALGLSNVVCDHDSDEENNNDGERARAQDEAMRHLTEEDLSQNTLWPETRKLYGHGNDLYCVAADPRGRYVASASRAQDGASAAVIVWDAATWSEVARLGPQCGLDEGHTLTVTCMECSPDGSMVATVGRDRRLVVWERCEDGWTRRAGKAKAHSRVIWGCSWAGDSSLVTCSRDGTVAMWELQGSDLVRMAQTKLEASVMTVGCSRDGRRPLIGAGLESGDVVVLSYAPGQFEIVASSDADTKHAAAVRHVAFAPTSSGKGSRGRRAGEGRLLSSVGEDGAVKMWTVTWDA
jgi:elongator complex protein 2